MPVITINHLSKTFRAKQKAAGFGGSLRSLVRPEYRDVRAVHEVSFEVEAGETLAFIGPNGAGKSTTIKMLVGILYPTGGEAQVLGHIPWKERTKLAYRIGAVFGQKSQLWYHLPPLDTFNLFARIYELEDGAYQQRLGQLVEVFEIEDYLRVPVRRLSLGERMRCEIAASLLHRPQILFLDEPTIGLDVIVKQKIRDLIRQLNREEGVTIFLTSHDAGDVEQLCKRAMVINHGEVIFDGRVSHLKRDYLRSKVIDLKLGERPRPADFATLPGVDVLKHKGYGLKLAVDTEQTAIKDVISAIFTRYSVVDITVANPPMEEIIAAIYQTGEKMT